jgi:hypothetical protein
MGFPRPLRHLAKNRTWALELTVDIMAFLIRPLVLVGTLFMAAMLWWRPAPFLLEMNAVNWAVEYEKRYAPKEDQTHFSLAGSLLNGMNLAENLKPSPQPYLPLTEFIHLRSHESLVPAQSEGWRTWYAAHFPKNGNKENPLVYADLNQPPVSQLNREQGYIEISGNGNIDHIHFRRLAADDFFGKNIPAGLRYPYRKQALIFLFAALAIMAWGRLRRQPLQYIGDSSAGKGCKATASILAAGIALGGMPFFLRIPDQSPPFVFLGVFVSLCGAIGLILYAIQAARLNAMICGRDRLVHWTYERFEWQQFVDWEFQRQKSMNTGQLILISGVILVIGAVLLLVERSQAAMMVFLFLAGLILFIWFGVFLLSRSSYHRYQTRGGEVYIGTSGLYINGAVHTWKFPGSRLEAVKIVDQPFDMLRFSYSYLVVAGRSLFTFRQLADVYVPVPKGKEEEAGHIASRVFG